MGDSAASRYARRSLPIVRSGLRWLAGIGLSSLLLWAALRGLDVHAVIHHVGSARLPPVAVGIGLFITAWLIRAVRWRFFLAGLRTGFREVLVILLVGNLGNVALPMRAGELVRASLGGVAFGCGIGRTLASIYVEKVADMAVISLMALGGLIGLAGIDLPSWIANATYLGAVMCLLGVGGIGAFVVVGEAGIGVAQRLEKRIPFAGKKLSGTLTTFRLGVIAAGGPPVLVPGLLLSIVIWSLEAGAYAFWLSAVGAAASASRVLLLVSLANLSLLLPAAPAGVGTFHYAAAQVTALWAPPEVAFASAILIHAVMLISLSIPGALALGFVVARRGYAWLPKGARTPASSATDSLKSN